MLYFTLKIVHVISASILFGTGLGTALYMFVVNFSRNTHLIARATAQVVFADWLFTATAGVVQALTGFAMIYLKSYPFSDLWVMGSIIGYLIAGVCWLPVVWLQIRCRDMARLASQNNAPLPTKYHQYFRYWYLLGIPAFCALLLVYYFMVSKITSF